MARLRDRIFGARSPETDAANAERVRAEARSLNARADVEMAEAKLRAAQADAVLAEAGAKAEAIRELSRVAGEAMSVGVPSDQYRVKGKGAGGLGLGVGADGSMRGRDVSPRSGDYDAARRTRTDVRFNAQGGAADYHLDPQTLETLANRTSSAQRNDIVARAMVKRLTAMIVQDGWSWEITSTNAAYREKAEKLVRQYMEVETIDLAGLCSMNEILGQCVGAMCYRGRVLVNLLDDGRVQLIENERLRNKNFGPNTRDMINGVELNGGRIAAYHVAEWDEYLSHAKFTTVRLDAAGAVLLRNPLDASEGQISGEPALAAIMPACDDLREFMRSTDIAARIATMFGGILESPQPAQMQQQLEKANSNPPTSDYAGKPGEIEMARGRILTAPMGTKFSQIVPQHPSINHSAYINTRLMLMGADIGLPVVLSQLDFTQVNFHSARSAVSVAWLGLAMWQGALTNRLIRRLVNQRLAWHIRRGDLPYVDDWDSYELYAPTAPVLDFTQEIDSALNAVRGGLMTYRSAIQRLNTGEWSSVFAQREIEMKDLRARGIMPADLPGASRPDGGGTGNNANTTTDTGGADAASKGNP